MDFRQKALARGGAPASFFGKAGGVRRRPPVYEGLYFEGPQISLWGTWWSSTPSEEQRGLFIFFTFKLLIFFFFF